MAVKRASDRTFGIAIASMLAVMTTAVWFYSGYFAYGLLTGSAAVLAVAFSAPWILTPLNRIAAWVGRYFGILFNYVILSLILFLIFTPFGIVMRMIGRDSMSRSFDATAESYLTPVYRQMNSETMGDLF